MDRLYFEIFSLVKSSGPYHRETTAEKRLAKLNKGPLLETPMVIWQELERSRSFLNKVVEQCSTDVEEKTSDLVANLEESFSGGTSSASHTLDIHFDEIGRKLTEWGNTLTSEMRIIMKEEIPFALPEVTKEAVKEISTNTKFMKPIGTSCRKLRAS